MLVMQRPTIEALDEESNNRQQFAVGPLEPGFGHTLGNSLRRTLLSSIPGAAITSVRFDDALHEFGTIAGVSEDVTDMGPFNSVIYKLGQLNGAKNDRPFEIYDSFPTWKPVSGFKIEALSGPIDGVDCDLSFGTEDEMYGGVCRVIRIE